MGRPSLSRVTPTQVPLPDIARAVNVAIASRLAGLVTRVGIANDVVLIGGLAKVAGVAEALASALGVPVSTPDLPEYTGAVGAALAARERASAKA